MFVTFCDVLFEPFEPCEPFELCFLSLLESVGVQDCSLLQVPWFEAAPASLVGSAAPLAGPRRTAHPDFR
jgi:hypothetical protein